MTTNYETDFDKWLSEQMIFLKKKDYDHLDIEHILEEMEDLGSSNKNAIESHLIVILLHMLKQKYQPDMNCNSWNASIAGARASIRKIIRRNPSLKNYPQSVVDECYEDARDGAPKESGVKSNTFPKTLPWNLKEILGE